MRVLVLPEVRQYLHELSQILYEKKDGLIYLVRYISNNHVIAHLL